MRVSDALMIDGRALSSAADEIISTLMDVVSVHVALVDLDEKRSHARMSSWWFSHELGTEEFEAAALNRAQSSDRVFVRINRRWVMRVAGRGVRTVDDAWIVTFGRSVPLSMEQVAFVERAAERLRPFLPATSKLSEVPSPNGTSGSGSGGAELGIPVWWARKTRNGRSPPPVRPTTRHSAASTRPSEARKGDRPLQCHVIRRSIQAVS